MVCCRCTLFIVPPKALNVGRCCAQMHNTFWNEKVTNVVYANNGTLVYLADEAVAKIAAVYDGTPLWVYLTCERKSREHVIGCTRMY